MGVLVFADDVSVSAVDFFGFVSFVVVVVVVVAFEVVVSLLVPL